MMNNHVNWRIWIIGGFLFILGFVWASEIVDLPHVLLNAPTTPVNWKESLLESVVVMIFTVISWNLVSRYERRWQKALEEMHQLAITDDLTKALNRRECINKGEMELQRALRFGRPFALTIMDFDNFKNVNDRHGHLTGDLVLKRFTEVVQANIRTQDVFGRMGGDEFLLAHVETPDEEQALQIIERIRAQWQEVQRAIVPQDGWSVTFSAGISTMKPDDQSLSDCIQRADQALYLAKAKGRNQIQCG